MLQCRRLKKRVQKGAKSKMDYAKESLKMHYDLKGKIEVVSRAKVDSKDALSLAYTPGVAQPCLEIQKDVNKSYDLTRRWNTVAVVTDGTAVLGLGDIGPEAGMPVMEGKSILFKEFANVDAFPICLDTKDVDEIVETVKRIAPCFGGINLEDISAPRCFEVEARLKKELDINYMDLGEYYFHDDKIDENYDNKSKVAMIRDRHIEFKLKKNQKVIRMVAIKQYKNFLAKPEGKFRLGLVTHTTSKKKRK